MGGYGIDRGGPVLECEFPVPGDDGSNAWVTPKSVKRAGNDGDFGESTAGIAKPTAKMFRDGFVSVEDTPIPGLVKYPHSPR